MMLLNLCNKSGAVEIYPVLVDNILKPVWFLAFSKPNLGCSYPRTKGAEDFTRANQFLDLIRKLF